MRTWQLAALPVSRTGKIYKEKERKEGGGARCVQTGLPSFLPTEKTITHPLSSFHPMALNLHKNCCVNRLQRISMPLYAWPVNRYLGRSRNQNRTISQNVHKTRIQTPRQMCPNKGWAQSEWLLDRCDVAFLCRIFFVSFAVRSLQIFHFFLLNMK